MLKKLSLLLYRKIYNRCKYLKFIQSPFAYIFIFPIYYLFNLFYFYYVLRFYNQHIDRLTKNSQLFIAGRRDFGTHLYILHYLRLWSQSRGDASLLVFTNEPDNIKDLAAILLPKVPIIFPDRIIDHLAKIVFGHYYTFHHTYLPIYFRLRAQRPDFIHMFDLAESPYAQYNEYLDSNLKDVVQTNFTAAYIQMRKQFDYQWNIFADGCLLNYSTQLKKIDTADSLNRLRKNLNFQNPYVLLNINTKVYPGHAARRTIYSPERYEAIIDSLIERGYDVILHGRQEQPSYSPRKGLFDYSKSPFCSIQNDLTLYNGCEFVVSSKTGVEIFATLCNVPILGLNYTEILGLQPSKKMRFYPKALRRISDQKFISWQEHLELPVFFEIGILAYEPKCEYIEMSIDEMMHALEEFIPLLQYSEDQWVTSYTPRQQSFKKKLTPLHMELFLSRGVPCDAYLKKYEFNEVSQDA